MFFTFFFRIKKTLICIFPSDKDIEKIEKKVQQKYILFLLFPRFSRFSRFFLMFYIFCIFRILLEFTMFLDIFSLDNDFNGSVTYYLKYFILHLYYIHL